MKKNKKGEAKDKDKVYAWIAIQSIVIIFAAVASFLVVEIGSRVMNNEVVDVHVFMSSLGMIIPMCILIGLLNSYLFKFTYKYITKLSDAMRGVSEGEFSIKLDTNKAGPFLLLYENFNKMGTELETVQSLKSDFINNYSHEFKTPISSIKGFADLLLDEDISEEEKRQYLKIISEESTRLTHLADSTLLMSKLDSQEIIENKKEYSLDNQIEECATILSREWKKKNINFSGNFEEIMYYNNPEIMKQLWINLMTNSLKYTPENGEIIVNLTQKNNQITMSIKDTGIGMSKEISNNMFEKYYQGDLSHATPGLGLGLSIVKRIVELCNGTISVESTEGMGTTFTVVLPNKL